jgi:hypothetical protein
MPGYYCLATNLASIHLILMLLLGLWQRNCSWCGSRGGGRGWGGLWCGGGRRGGDCGGSWGAVGWAAGNFYQPFQEIGVHFDQLIQLAGLLLVLLL